MYHTITWNTRLFLLDGNIIIADTVSLRRTHQTSFKRYPEYQYLLSHFGQEDSVQNCDKPPKSSPLSISLPFQFKLIRPFSLISSTFHLSVHPLTCAGQATNSKQFLKVSLTLSLIARILKSPLQIKSTLGHLYLSGCVLDIQSG